MERTLLVEIFATLLFPTVAWVSVIAYVLYPVFNNTTMSFTCKWITVDNCLFDYCNQLMSFTLFYDRSGKLSFPLCCNVFLTSVVLYTCDYIASMYHNPLVKKLL
jgi:galactitol-specific phosphotransferase system IIC component